MCGTVVIGEGEKVEAPMLFNGEAVGDGSGPEYDIAVDPVDGTSLLATGRPDSIAVIAASDRGSLFDPSAVFYMEKLVVGAWLAGCVDPEAPVEENIAAVARELGGQAADVAVAVLDRPRHHELIDTFLAATGIADGDLVRGVRYTRNGARTHTLVTRSPSGTTRRVESAHALGKVRLHADLTDRSRN